MSQALPSQQQVEPGSQQNAPAPGPQAAQSNGPHNAQRLIQDSLLTIPKFGDGIGLHRMQWLIERIRQETPCPFNAIKVTGSNGKGSVCAMLSSMLQQLGLAHGLYTSPHLFRFNERIRFGAQEIRDEELIDAIAWWQQQQSAFQQAFPDDRIGAFEAFTAIALQVFAKNKLSCLVSEAGIGGRFDATRMIAGDIAALTSLDLEHTALLGNTLEQIAYDKADLCPPGGTLVVGRIGPALTQRLSAYCAANQIRMVVASSRCLVPNQQQDQQQNDQQDQQQNHQQNRLVDINIDGKIHSGIKLNLTGQHQQHNAEVAVCTLLEWLERYYPDAFDAAQLEQAIRTGLETVLWHGRGTLLQCDPEVYIDVGHSPAAVEAAVHSLRHLCAGKPVLLVTGVSQDKAIAGILQHLLPLASSVIATRAHHKGAPVDEIAHIIRQQAPALSLSTAPDIQTAMQQALAQARRE
ncbi:MAG: hypothetical protein RL748_4072, partial [Pseudomonadota bacterium]